MTVRLVKTKRVTAAQIVMGGKQYTKGLGTHSPADVGFELSGKCKAFKATVGVQDGQSGSVTFRVVGTTDGY